MVFILTVFIFARGRSSAAINSSADLVLLSGRAEVTVECGLFGDLIPLLAAVLSIFSFICVTYVIL